MNKKYYSTDEFYKIDQDGKKIPYSGYVSIKNGTAYIFDTEITLIPSDGYNTMVNLSDEYFDRNLDRKLLLPHSLTDCTFSANDYLKQSVLNRIIKNLDENNRYIYKNCLVSRNDLPVAEIIPVLSPWRYIKEEGANTVGHIDKWAWSNISYNYINDINVRNDWFTGGSDYNFTVQDIVDSDLTVTDKLVTDSNSPEHTDIKSAAYGEQLYAIFIAARTEIRLIYLPLFPNDKLSRYSDPILDIVNSKTENNEKLIEELHPRFWNFESIYIRNVDPQDVQSFKFKDIAGLKISGNHLYVVDKGLNGIFKYDISNCLTDKGPNFNNKIHLVNKLYGLGNINAKYYFDSPTGISAFNNTVAVLDKGNLCVKVFDSNFNHFTTIRQGAFIRQNPMAVQICPYDFKLDDIIVEAGSIFVLSEVSKKISIDVYKKDGTYIKNKEIKYVTLETTLFDEDKTNICTSTEYIKKIEFSANDSNLYYIITSRRIIKLHLSNLIEPIGISNVISKVINGEPSAYSITWKEANNPNNHKWGNVTALSDKGGIWGNMQSTVELTHPYNHCFSIGWNPKINSDIIFTIPDNIIYYDVGLIHRIDNYRENRKLYYTNDGAIVYDEITNGEPNTPVMVEANSFVAEYVENEGTPIKNNTYFYIKGGHKTDNYLHNTIMFYKEPNEYKSLLMKPDLKLYTLDEISTVMSEEYVSQLSLNKLMYKLLFNLNEIRHYLYGTFTAGYSIENIMTYDSIAMDYSISSSDIGAENFIFGENERVSIVLNRCFENIYRAQINTLNKIQTKFISATNYNLHAYKSI